MVSVISLIFLSFFWISSTSDKSFLINAFVASFTFSLAISAICTVSTITCPLAILGVWSSLRSRIPASLTSSSPTILFAIRINKPAKGSNANVFNMLKIKWIKDIWSLILSGDNAVTVLIKISLRGRIKIAPIRLNSKWITAAFFAILLAEMEDKRAVIHVPMFAPKMIGKPTAILILPVVVNATRTPVVAEDDCTNTVIPKPIKIPRYHWLPMAIIKFLNTSESLKGYIASLISSIPNIKIPNPRRILATSRLFLAFAKRNMREPEKIKMGTTAPIFKETKNAVVVVPMLAPMITPVAWTRVSNPELTNPITITVVAELDCIKTVTITPTNTALMGLPVTLFRINCNLEPAAFSRPSPIIFMPYRKRPNPPKRPMIIVTKTLPPKFKCTFISKSIINLNLINVN